MSPFVPFVALEFSSAIGPPAGRYMVREPDGPDADGAIGAAPPRVERATGVIAEAGSADVLQIAIVGASAARGGLVFRRARRADADEEPREVSLLIATLIGAASPLDSHADAVRFLDGTRADEAAQADLVGQAVDVVNVAIRAFRAVARDPFIPEITVADAREIRIGYGEAQDLYVGGWSEAFTPPPPRAPQLSRAERLRPAEGVALALGGRLPLLDAEDLALRTMLDLERGRPRSAALQLRACLDMIVAELTAAGESFVPPRDELERRAGAVERLAALALDDRLDEAALDELAEHLDRVEDALEDWRAWHNSEVPGV